MAAGARQASTIIGREVYLWEIQRILDGKKSITGLEVSELSPRQQALETVLKSPGGEPYRVSTTAN